MEAAQEERFVAFARERWPSFVRSAVFLGAGAHEAEDVAQAALVRCYRAWEKVCGADDRDAYVYRILLNCLHDLHRPRWRRERPSDALPDTGEQHPGPLDALATADAVHRALRGLSRPNRAVVVLRYFAGLSEQQTAAVLGVPAGTVKSRLSRSLARLATDHHLADLTGGTRSTETPRSTP